MSASRYVLLFALLTPAFAQRPVTTPSVPPAPPAANRILLDVVVDQKHGDKNGPVASLPEQAFTVYDNKIAQPITSFKAVGGPSAPIAVTLAVDAINVDFTRIAYERDQIDHFLKSDEGRLAYPTTLAILNDTQSQIQQGFTRDGNQLASDLEQYTIGLRTIRRSAGIYGADDRLQLSLTALENLVRREATLPGRKILLWVSPGWPILSGPNIQLTNKQQNSIYASVMNLSNQLRAANITLYAINPLGAGESPERTFYYEQFVKGITKPSQAQLGNLSLQVLAEQSGGKVFSSSNDTAALLTHALDDGKAYYELAYTPPASERPGEYHHIEVKLADPGLSARTRDGYYTAPINDPPAKP